MDHQFPYGRVQRPLAGFTVLWFMDWATTIMVFTAGGTEGNPFMAGFNALQLLGFKTAWFLVIGLALYASYKLAPDKPFPWVLGLQSLVVVYAGVNLWNLRNLALLVTNNS